MADKKRQLTELKVKSFITLLSEADQKSIAGGYVPIISSKKNNWTYADTRAELYEDTPSSPDSISKAEKRKF